jgi:hypothetical protein
MCGPAKQKLRQRLSTDQSCAGPSRRPSRKTMGLCMTSKRGNQQTRDNAWRVCARSMRTPRSSVGADRPANRHRDNDGDFRLLALILERKCQKVWFGQKTREVGQEYSGHHLRLTQKLNTRRLLGLRPGRKGRRRSARATELAFSEPTAIKGIAPTLCPHEWSANCEFPLIPCRCCIFRAKHPRFASLSYKYGIVACGDVIEISIGKV